MKSVPEAVAMVVQSLSFDFSQAKRKKKKKKKKKSRDRFYNCSNKAVTKRHRFMKFNFHD